MALGEAQMATLDRRVSSGRRARVDVVIPFFNHGVFIEESVASVRRQTHAVDRVIVVDDGSTDRHSLDVLRQLEAEGSVEVVHQANQGPSAARNRGIDASSADAILFHDGDDLLPEGYVASGLGALAAAEATVGFAYPDQQCFGTVDDLAVMPPYNLYILANRNFAGTACLVDAAVFAEGHRFREDLRHGHEDWEFYLRLGLAGIQGIDFHDAPVQWRRWGYSRSDGINDRIGQYADEIRKLHPEMFVPERMVELKRRWSPALSIVLAGHQDAADVASAMARQTCGDYELLTVHPDQPRRVRGRWVLAVDTDAGRAESARWLLGQANLVERILRACIEQPPPSSLWLANGQPDGTVVRWQRVEPRDPTSAIGLVIDGRSYDDWMSRTSSSVDDHQPGTFTRSLVVALRAATSSNPQWRWIGTASVRPVRTAPKTGGELMTPLPPPPLLGRPRDDSGRKAAGCGTLSKTLEETLEDSFEQERTARWSAPPLFLPADGVSRLPRPPDGFVDGLDAMNAQAWATWVPSQTCGLDLVVDHAGRGLLEVCHPGPVDRTARPPVGARIRLGRLWTRNFPGTMPLYARTDIYTHRVTYQVSDEPPRSKHDVRLGYVAIEPLSDMVSLDQRLEFAVARLEQVFGTLVAPMIDIPDAGAFLEPVSRDVIPAEAVILGRLAPLLYGSGGLGATLYELLLSGTRVRYVTHPDACVGRPDVVRPVALAVGELGPVRPGSSAPALQELMNADGGGTAYVTGPIAGNCDPGQVPGPVLGTFSPNLGASAPLVRLRPGPSAPAPAGEPGHRLAVDWEPLVKAGYVAEGVVGYTWLRDPHQAPLYCWDAVDGRERLLTLAEPPHGDRSRWRFRGTLGLAWQPHTERHDLVPLWELRLGDRVTYAIDPGEFEPLGFARTRVVARVPLQRRPGSIPLWRIGTVDEPRWRFTTCPDEGTGDGFVRQGVICFLDPAHPQPIDDIPVGTTVPGPVPFGLPVYRVVDERGRPLPPTARPSLTLGVVVEEVAGYLPPTNGPMPDEPSAGPAAFSHAAITVAGEPAAPEHFTPPTDQLPTDQLIELLLRRAAAHLPGGIRRLLSAARHRRGAGPPSAQRRCPEVGHQ